MRLRLENHRSALNGPLDSPVHDHSLGGDGSGDLGFARDNERRAMHLTLYLPIDLNQTLRSHYAYNFEAFGNHRSPTL